MCLCAGSGRYRVSTCERGYREIVTRICDCPAQYGVREKESSVSEKRGDFPYGDEMRGGKMDASVYAPKGAPRTPLSKASEALQRHAQNGSL